FLVQYLTPLLMAEYDTFIVAPPGRSQIEALLIPIINKIMFSLVDGKKLDRRPYAIILSSNNLERRKILSVIDALTKDLPVVAAEHKSIDGLTHFVDFMSEDGRIDILITTPAAYIAFTRRVMRVVEGEMPKRFPGKIGLDRLQYLVIFEIEECCDSDLDYSRIIANHRKEKDFTLIMLTHTSFVNRGASKKYFGHEHAQRRSKFENLLNEDYGLVVVDSSACITNLVLMNDSDLSKIRHLRAILEHHKDKFYRMDEEKGLHKYMKRVLIVVADRSRAQIVHGMLTSGSNNHVPLIEPKHILHLEKNLEFKEGGRWYDPHKKMKTGQVIGFITTNIHGVRIGHSPVDKIIFFDVVPNLHSLVLNCSKIIDNRRNIFMVGKNDFIHKRKELQSLVQYLKNVDADIPADLRVFETDPTSEKSIFT
ncbi:hypothetical protein PMAYCL1PPCAC_22465, partial [Pristionchus mayeri]